MGSFLKFLKYIKYVPLLEALAVIIRFRGDSMSATFRQLVIVLESYVIENNPGKEQEINELVDAIIDAINKFEASR